MSNVDEHIVFDAVGNKTDNVKTRYSLLRFYVERSADHVFTIPVDHEMQTAIICMCNAGHKVEAMKVLRRLYDISLRSAKNVVEKVVELRA